MSHSGSCGALPDGAPAALSGSLSRALWDDCRLEANQSLYHPFVQAMAWGNLDIACFRHYVAQDAFFLKHFACAYAMALAQCTNADDDTYATLTKLLRGVHAELKLHAGYAKRWGVDLDATTASDATRAYTDFLMQACAAEKASRWTATDPLRSCASGRGTQMPCTCRVPMPRCAATQPSMSVTASPFSTFL